MATLSIRVGDTSQEVRLSARPTYIGRGPTNDVVLPDETISSRHLSAWLQGGEVWVEDLGSRNGTWLGEDRVVGARRVPAGSELRLGVNTLVEVGASEDAQAPRWAIEVEPGGLRWPLHDERVELPSIGEAVLRGDSLSLRTPDYDLVELPPDRSVQVGEHRLRRIALSDAVPPTVRAEDLPPAYRATASLNGPTGPYAELRDLRSGSTHRVQAMNRAILLYLLVQAASEQAALPAAERGWVADVDLIRGVWGRTTPGSKRNNLNVLLCRTRKELDEHGFDPWCIDKRQRRVRLHVQRAEVADAT